MVLYITLQEKVGGMASQKVTGLTELQNRFCLINLSAEIRIADKNQIHKALTDDTLIEVSLYKKQEGNLLLRRYLEALSIASDAKKDIDNFLINPKTHVYDQVAFSPRTLPSTTLNYWTGSTITPTEGDWNELGKFLLNVICNEDQDVFKYLMYYLAHMLKKPEEKSGIMIVLLGGQGTGKGTFFTLLKAIWAKTCLQINDVDQVLGTFNAALERNYIVCMDEALFSGDKKSLEKLKSLITEPQCRIEQKYQPSRTIDSYHRFFAASNNDHFANIDKDDRRFLFLRVSDKYQSDLKYFENLYKLIADGTQVSALVYDLLALDLSSFNVRQRPKTGEHLSQKLQSLDGLGRYWYEVLQSGVLTSGEIYNPKTKWEDSIFVSTQSLIDQYKGFNKNADRYSPVQANTINTAIEKLCPSALKARPSVYGTQTRGYQLPSIQTARTEFEHYIGGKLNWDDESDDEGIKTVIENDLTNNSVNESEFLKSA